MPLRDFNARMRQNPPTTARFTASVSDSAQAPDRLPNYGLRSVPQIIAGVNSADVLDLNRPGGVSRGSFLTSYFNPRQPTSRAHEWNLTFEREMFDNTLLRFGYVGTHGSRLDMYYTYNQSPNDYVWFTTQGVARPTGTFAGTATRNFETTTFGSIEEYQKTGWSNAQNFQVELQRRYANGFGFQVFYVMSNALKAGGSGWEDDNLPSDQRISARRRARGQQRTRSHAVLSAGYRYPEAQREMELDRRPSVRKGQEVPGQRRRRPRSNRRRMADRRSGLDRPARGGSSRRRTGRSRTTWSSTGQNTRSRTAAAAPASTAISTTTATSRRIASTVSTRREGRTA